MQAIIITTYHARGSAPLHLVCERDAGKSYIDRAAEIDEGRRLCDALRNHLPAGIMRALRDAMLATQGTV